MQTVLVKQIRPPTPCQVGNRMEVTHYKEIVEAWRKGTVLPPSSRMTRTVVDITDVVSSQTAL